MKVASDVLGDLKTAYVDKTIVKKLDEHKPLEDLDALNLIGGVFSAGYQAKRKHLALANPFNDFYAEEKKESRRDARYISRRSTSYISDRKKEVCRPCKS